MGRNTSIGDMAGAIMEGLQEYAEMATDEMKKAVKKAGNTIRNEIRENAPKETGTYANSWAVKKQEETANAINLVVHSRNRYQIAHLLEHGHAKRGGGRVAAKPHIAAAEQTGIDNLEKEIEKALEG